MKTDEKLIAIGFTIYFFLCALVIVDVARGQESLPTLEPTWTPPTIPQCDKPLWERVRNGC